MLPYNQLPDTPWISVDAAIAWIALRYACPIQEWNALPAWEMQHPGLGCAREIVDDTLKAAGRDLVNAVTKGRITAWESGQWEVGKRDPNAPAQQLPKEAFAESLTTALAGFLGWSTQGRNYPGPFFPQTSFTVSELRGVWPPARTKSPPAPVHIDDLPADWSLLEAIAWIMFRDTGIVQQAASEQPRDATEYWSKNQFRDEKPILKLLSGEVGLSPISLMIMFAERASEEAPTTILNYGEAKTELLQQLCAGRIAATGLRNSVTECREMTTADWRGKILPYAGSFDPPNTPMTDEAMSLDPSGYVSGPSWSDPLDADLFRMAQFLANMNPHQLIAWPQHAGPVWHSSFLKKFDLLSIWPAVRDDVSGPGTPKIILRENQNTRKQYSKTEIENWGKEYIALFSLNETPPTEAATMAEAKKKFPHIPRGTVRDLRHGPLAPASWNKRGRPKKTRGSKSPAKSRRYAASFDGEFLNPHLFRIPPPLTPAAR